MPAILCRTRSAQLQPRIAHAFYYESNYVLSRWIEDEQGVPTRRVYGLSLNNNCRRLAEDNVLYPRHTEYVSAINSEILSIASLPSPYALARFSPRRSCEETVCFQIFCNQTADFSALARGSLKPGIV